MAKKINLSDFIKMSREDMEKHLKKCDLTNKESQVTPSICHDDYEATSSWEPKRVAYDVWSDFEKFNINIDECDWDPIPHIVYTFNLYKNSIAEELLDHSFYRDSILLKKKSKYGEILFMSVSYDKKYGLSVVSGSISEERNNYPIIPIGEGHSLEHFNGLPMKFNAYRDVKGNVFNELHKNELKDFVIFPLLPKNISIYEYGQEVEKFAKNVSENPNLYYEEKAKEHNFKFLGRFNERWSLTHDKYMPTKDADFLSYISLKYMFPNITVDDYNKTYDVISSEIKDVMKFLKTCRKPYIDKFFIEDDEYFLFGMHDHFNNDHTYCYVINPISLTDLILLVSLFSKLDKFRELNVNAIDTKKLQAEADKEYHEIRKKISDDYCKDLATEYKRIVAELSRIEKTYNNKLKEVDKAIREKYNMVDLDRIVGDGEDDRIYLTYNIKKSLSFITEESYAIEDGEVFEKIIGMDKISAAVKKHMAKIFELDPDIDHVIISAIYKSYDSPYEVYMNEDFADNNEDIYDLMVEKWGEKAADKWITKFETFDFSDKLNENDGNDLYPGHGQNLILTDAMQFNIIDDNGE